MKKRSATKAAARHEPLVYFTDRDLGKRFPGALRESGLAVCPYHEVFSGDEKVTDPAWIRHACSQGWVCLTHDHAIRKSEYALGELFEAQGISGALFVIRGGATGPKLIQMFLEARKRVERMTLRYRKLRNPFMARILRGDAKGGREVVHVRLHMDLEEWKKRNRKIFE